MTEVEDIANQLQEDGMLRSSDAIDESLNKNIQHFGLSQPVKFSRLQELQKDFLMLQLGPNTKETEIVVKAKQQTRNPHFEGYCDHLLKLILSKKPNVVADYSQFRNG